ncbi:hypothetical protein Taro_048766 [Colocasia esculenta]|uniref:Uncharacterized protein n=1 Tax=Colocasia esculenta TaxID=4460 RepID=A0A843X8Z8_COLES|nr:hypothetical protein [Colocasia esculenta]
MPPTATATLSVHIQCRQVHAVNVHLPGRQQVNGHPWPPTPTEQQQVGGCNHRNFSTCITGSSAINTGGGGGTGAAKGTSTLGGTGATGTASPSPGGTATGGTAETTPLEVLTLHRYGAALSWMTVVRRPPRSHLWGKPRSSVPAKVGERHTQVTKTSS